MTLRLGDKAEHKFVVDAAAMGLFQSLSHDRSRIHCDPDFARSRGYKDVIVYGGIMLAHLSHVLGQMLPGALATSTKWTINYRGPLYVGEEATLNIAVTHVSRATGIVECKFRIASREQPVATGNTQSVVPLDEIEQPDEKQES